MKFQQLQVKDEIKKALKDLGFKEMPSLESKEVLWGGQRVIAGSGGGGGSGPLRTPQKF